MIRIQQLKLPIHHTQADLEKALRKRLGIGKESLIAYEIRRQSLDARKKPELFYVYTVDAEVKNERALKGRKHRKDVLFIKKERPYRIKVSGTIRLPERPVIIGTGLPDCSVDWSFQDLDTGRFFWSGAPLWRNA